MYQGYSGFKYNYQKYIIFYGRESSSFPKFFGVYFGLSKKRNKKQETRKKKKKKKKEKKRNKHQYI